jgi:hypothetical protein
MGFLVLVIVTVGATALGIVAATGMLLLLFHLMRRARRLANASSRLPGRSSLEVGNWTLRVLHDA